MALLDVSDVLLDPMFLDAFSVLRRVETIGTNGRSVITPTQTDGVQGVVTAGASQLDRRADMQVMPRTITVVTKFRLQGEVTGNQPDVLIWRGDNYLVKLVDYYPQFGAGFIQAECESMDSTDVAPV